MIDEVFHNLLFLLVLLPIVVTIALSRLNVSPVFFVEGKLARIRWTGINTNGVVQENQKGMSQKDTVGLTQKLGRSELKKIEKDCIKKN